MDEPTPWEDINPPMALAHRPVQPSQCSALQSLQPATRDDFRRELTACLSLVAPAGMDEAARREWLTVAWGTLGHLPADILAIGARKAREKCDHPSKIVPAILAETRDLMNWRRTAAKPEAPLPRQIESRPCSPEQAREILNAHGIPPLDAKRPDPPPLRKPTRADYIALGVDPAVLDAIPNA